MQKQAQLTLQQHLKSTIRECLTNIPCRVKPFDYIKKDNFLTLSDLENI